MRIWCLILIASCLVSTAAVAQILRRSPLSPLPDGRLLLVSGSNQNANFIALDQSSKQGSTADLWIFAVYAPPVVIGGGSKTPPLKIEQTFAHFKIDCIKRRVEKLSDDGFDDSGRWLMAGPGYPSEPIAPNSAPDFMAKVMCDGVKPPAPNLVMGHVAAAEATRRIFSASKGHPAP